jgi:hypothetical protein
MTDVAQCAQLQTLSVHFLGDPVYARQLADLRSLIYLEIFGASADMLAQLQPLVELRTLKLRDSDVGMLTDFVLPHNVSVLSCQGCTQRGGTGTRDHAPNVPLLEGVEDFTWRGGNLVNLQFLHRMPYLRNLAILDCESLRSLEGLEYPQRLEKVIISGTPSDIDERYIFDQLREKACQVIYEPNYDIDPESFFFYGGGA